MTSLPGVLKITDGTDSVDIRNGILKLVDWRPAIFGPKSGGVWRQSPLTTGRQLVIREWDNVIDGFTLSGQGASVADAIAELQKLRQLLTKAQDYWITTWQNEPVWIEALSPCETNTRYAIIHDWRTPQDENPYLDSFSNQALIGDDFELIIEHGIWQGDIPGEGTCLPISASQCYGFPFALLFDGDDDEIDCGSNAVLDDLPAADFTFEAWVRLDSNADSFIAYKAQWRLAFDTTDGISFLAGHAVTDAESDSGTDDFEADGEWHHIAVVWDIATKLADIYIDGVEVSSYDKHQAGVGAYNTDAAANLFIGSRAGSTSWTGAIGWCRISNNERYSAPFTPPARCLLPDVDANTIALWICEGTGATTYNRVGTAGTDGTITGATWLDACCE